MKSVAVGVLLVAVSAGCTSSDETATPTTVEVTSTTVAADEPTSPPTLAPGYAPPVSELTSVEVDLSAECAEAIEPIRALTGEFDSGLVLDDDANEVLNAALAAGREACDVDEWATYQSDELNGWMNAATSEPAEEPVADETTDGDLDSPGTERD